MTGGMTGAKSGRVVIVNGTSGSGKSTTCEKFVQGREDFWLLYGIDHFLAGTVPAKFGHHGPFAALGIEAVPLDPADAQGPLRWRLGEHGMQAFATLNEWIASAARSGANIIADHLLFTDPPVLADLARRLDGIDALLITLKPPFEVLERRVAERAMTKKLPVGVLGEDAVAKIVNRLARLRPWFYDEVYRNDFSDLVIDSDANGPEAVVAMIEVRLLQGPGTAFAQIRANAP
jgi:chloramphenicol 3-O-phosphotransferase